MQTLYSCASEYRKDSILVHDLYDSLNSQIVAEIHYKYIVIWSKKEDRNIIGLQSEKLKEYSVWVSKIYTLLYKKNACSYHYNYNYNYIHVFVKK